MAEVFGILDPVEARENQKAKVKNQKLEVQKLQRPLAGPPQVSATSGNLRDAPPPAIFEMVYLLIKSPTNRYHLYYQKDKSGRGGLICKSLGFNRIDNIHNPVILRPFVFNKIMGSFCKKPNFVIPFPAAISVTCLLTMK